MSDLFRNMSDMCFAPPGTGLGRAGPAACGRETRIPGPLQSPGFVIALRRLGRVKVLEVVAYARHLDVPIGGVRSLDVVNNAVYLYVVGVACSVVEHFAAVYSFAAFSTENVRLPYFTFTLTLWE